MKTKGLRLYGVNDLRLDEFELPRIKRMRYWQEL